jgi:hypothetical protein
VRINGRDIGIRGAWKDSGFIGSIQGFVGGNHVSLEGIRFRWLRCEYGVMMVRYGMNWWLHT